MLSFYPFPTYIMHSLSCVSQTVRSEEKKKNIFQWLLLAGKSKQREQSFNYSCSKSRGFWKWLKYDLIFAWLFSSKDSNFWCFSCICKVTSMVLQGLSWALFYSKDKKICVNTFATSTPLLCSQKISENIIFSVGISGFKWNIGWKWVK